nr:filamentous hemagglutinin family protein [Caulobacteraceae bacterium]
DVSGINGGSVGLYGAGGVHLEDGSRIDAHADGYGGTDTRQASGGTVTLGVDGSGAIQVDSGAVIDVSARDPGNRLVPLMRSNGVFYTYVPGDQGGNLILRAPVAPQGGAETVPVSFAGSVTGANNIVLEGFQRFDLGVLANDPNFTGVQIIDGQAVLDLGAAGEGLLNPLSDYGTGTVVQFVRDFDLSASYGGLNGLASQANFHARPGIELDYSGDIVLDSNWNFGAGTVDVAGAVAAGLMAPVPGLDGRFYVLPGKEADLFAHYTTLTYRVGGAVDGEPGVLTLRAGGNLDLKGSITDGFFQFRDQTDPDYLSLALAGGKGVIPAPYGAAANAPGALGSGPGGAGDPLGSAELFPLLPTADGGTRPVESWSYQLIGGAALAGSAGSPSVDPLATVLGSDRSVTVEGRSVYCYPAALCQVDAGLTGASPDKGAPTYAVASTLIRTGTGNIEMAASGDIDLTNGPPTILDSRTGLLVAPPPGGLQLGGAAVYTAGHLAQLGLRTATNVATGASLTVDLGANRVVSDVFTTVNPASYGYGANFSGFAGILIANPVYLEGGGDVSLAASNVLGRRDTELESLLGGVGRVQAPPTDTRPWIGTGDQPWRTGAIGGVTNALINPQLFTEGVGTLAGGYITIVASRDVSDLSIVSTASLTTGNVAGDMPNALAALSGGNIDIAAGRDFLGGRIDVASGQVNLTVHDDIATAGRLVEGNASPPGLFDNTLRLRLSDAMVHIQAGGAVTLQGIAALGVKVNRDQGNAFQNNLDAAGFYAPDAAVSIVADGSVTLANLGPDVATAGGVQAALNTQSAVYPGSLEAVSVGAGLDIVTTPGVNNGASGAFLVPSPSGTLRLLAAGDIAPLTIAMDDGDPSLLPGAFSIFDVDAGTGVLLSGRPFLFPAVLPNTPDVARRTLHNSTPTHAGDAEPNRIIAGGDIVDMIFSSPKQTRISAGEDIIDMVFFGQNLLPADITRIFAGRDITATTTLERPVIGLPDVLGNQLPAVQGNTFLVGGPGAVFVEAGRDAGPFLNSAVTDGFVFDPNNVNPPRLTGALTYGGGILAVGNLNNPWLPEKSADIYTEFGVAKGQNFAGLESYYLSPANFANLPDYLFAQATDANGVTVVDRNREIYAAGLVDWFRSIASGIVAKYDATIVPGAPPPPKSPLVQFAEALLNGQAVTLDQALAFLPQVADQRLPLIPWLQLTDAAALTSAYGTLDVTYDQAFAALQALPALTQREYLLKNVYFNELVQTSIPTSPSYLKYARGYQAVNTLFPATLGYTQNDLTGGSNGANTPILTGNLDLRLATIQTAQGGDIFILGPGGRVLAGSTVRTSEQAARRVYDGGRLFSGNLPGAPLTAVIDQIPVGYEGVLTLRGGLIDSFTDGDFLLNQSRLFTEEGGDVTLWSSNANLNAGQGPKTSANFPPIAVRIDEDGFSRVDSAAGVSGAGIAAFQPDPTAAAPDVALIAPRGTVDAGDAGVRSAGNVFIAAFQVANADAIQANGAVFGDHSPGAVDVAAQTSASAATAAAAQAAQAVAGSGGDRTEMSVITVDVLGYVTDVGDTSDEDDDKRKKRK